MFKKKFQNFLLLTIVGFLIFFLSTRTILAQIEEPAFSLSLNFQKILKDLWQKIIPKEEDTYKEKYYELLQELAKLKLALKTIKEEDLINFREKYLPQVAEVDVLKRDDFGNYYISIFPNINEGMTVIDKNWSLVGKVKKVFKNYALVESLETPNLEFNVTNLDGQLLGLGKTIPNGFLEVNFADPNLDIKLNDFVLSGEGIFPSGFVIGSVTKIYKNQYNQKIIVKITFDSSSNKFLVLKK